MTPEQALARQWAALKRAGMLRAALWRPQQIGAAAVPADVMHDAPGVSVLDGVQSFEPTARYRVADWPAVAPGDRIEIEIGAGMTVYEVRETLSIDDGLMARAALRRLN